MFDRLVGSPVRNNVLAGGGSYLVSLAVLLSYVFLLLILIAGSCSCDLDWAV